MKVHFAKIRERRSPFTGKTVFTQLVAACCSARLTEITTDRERVNCKLCKRTRVYRQLDLFGEEDATAEQN